MKIKPTTLSNIVDLTFIITGGVFVGLKYGLMSGMATIFLAIGLKRLK